MRLVPQLQNAKTQRSSLRTHHHFTCPVALESLTEHASLTFEEVRRHGSGKPRCDRYLEVMIVAVQY